MEKRYTMKEFEEMFKEAEVTTIAKMEKQLRAADEDNKGSSMFYVTFTMQNMMCLAELHSQLFKNN